VFLQQLSLLPSNILYFKAFSFSTLQGQIPIKKVNFRSILFRSPVFPFFPFNESIRFCRPCSGRAGWPLVLFFLH